MILITGGAGYIGSHVNKMLGKYSISTLVLDNLIYGYKDSVKWGIFIEGDLQDEDKLENIFSKFPIEAVMHFSAYAYVGESMVHPAKYYRNNIANTIHLLDAMVRHNVKYFVFSSTCAIYGRPMLIPVTEDAMPCPINPYGRTKLAVEQMLEDYHSAYGLQYCILRYFNAAGADPEMEIGERHNPETHLIPLILDVALGKRPNNHEFGLDYPTRDGTCIRDYIHVNDLADAHIRALEYIKKYDCSEKFNLGNGIGYSVNEVIDMASDVTGMEIPVLYKDRRLGDPPELIGSSEKAMKLLGWKPQYDLRMILETAWRWHAKDYYSYGVLSHGS